MIKISEYAIDQLIAKGMAFDRLYRQMLKGAAKDEALAGADYEPVERTHAGIIAAMGKTLQEIGWEIRNENNRA